MEPGELIKEARKRRQWSQADLAKRVGVSQPAIKKIEAGDTTQSKHLPKIAQLLGIDLSLLDRSLAKNQDLAPKEGASVNQRSDSVVQPRNVALQTIPGDSLMGSVDLPVFAFVQGGQGALVLSNEPFSRIARPHNLIGIKNAYGVLVIDDSVAREFNSGDTAYVNPFLVPRKGDPCVFQGHHEDGTVVAVLKYLRRSPDASETVWYVSQTNPEKDFTLKKSEWQICHVVVGKLSGR
jgi:transcriptional regulator with XRE-family HTH domain